MCHIANIIIERTQKQREAINELNRFASMLADLIDKNCPPGEELIEAKKYLDAALMWAHGAITRQ